MGQVAAPGLGGPTQGGGELDHRELRHLRTPLPTQRQAGLVPRLGRTDHRPTRVHRRPPRRGPHHPSSGVVLVPLRPARSRQHGSGVVALSELGPSGCGSRVEVIVGPTQPLATDSRRPGNRVVHRRSEKVFEASCGGLDKLDQRWTSGCLRCGGFETVAARPPQPPPVQAGPPTPDRSQPADVPSQGHQQVPTRGQQLAGAGVLVALDGGRDTLGFGSVEDRHCTRQNRKLYGDGGRDHLTGSRLRDVLVGGPGRDRADGRGGRDRCAAEPATPSSKADRDLIEYAAELPTTCCLGAKGTTRPAEEAASIVASPSARSPVSASGRAAGRRADPS